MKALPVQREARLRFGIVIGEGGGFLSPLRLLTNLGAGQIVGDGRQEMSFVHRSDIINVIKIGLENLDIHGALNLVAPEVVTQAEFQRTLSRLMHRPTLFKVPAFLPRIALGEMAGLVLGSQRVRPKRLKEIGYTFLYPDLSSALSEALDLRPKKGKLWPCHRLEHWQFVARDLSDVAPFFSTPQNLEQITPPMLSFKIKSISSPEIQEGTIIHYSLKLRGIPMSWQTRICDWEMPHRFSDNQESGPYAIWFHTHAFFPVSGGTLMTDHVRYRLPFGLLGELFAMPLVKRDVKGIFSYRRRVIDKEFPAMYHSPHAQT